MAAISAAISGQWKIVAAAIAIALMIHTRAPLVASSQCHPPSAGCRLQLAAAAASYLPLSLVCLLRRRRLAQSSPQQN